MKISTNNQFYRNSYLQKLKSQSINKFLSYGLLSTCILISSACTKTETKYLQDKKQIVVETNENTTDSDLADGAEQLFSPYTFMYTYKLSALALQKNPQNLKAQFYFSLLKPLETFRGYLNIVKPVLSKEELNELTQNINKIPNSALKDFFNEPVSDDKKLISKEDNVRLVRNYFKELNNFRSFLKSIEDQELNLRLNPYVFKKEISEKLANSCKVTEVDGTSSYVCDTANIAQTSLDKTDILAIRQIVSGWVLYGVFLTAYNLDGLEKVLKLDEQNLLSPRAKIDLLFRNSNFGTLSKDHLLGEMKKIGSDLVAGYEWMLEEYKNGCKTERKDHLANSKCDFLVTNDSYTQLDFLRNSILGPVIIDIMHSDSSSSSDGNDETHESKISTQVDVFAWSNRPVSDLRNILQGQFNECGQLVKFKDETFGGIFLDQNASKLILKSDCQ